MSNECIVCCWVQDQERVEMKVCGVSAFLEREGAQSHVREEAAWSFMALYEPAVPIPPHVYLRMIKWPESACIRLRRVVHLIAKGWFS